MPYGGGGTLQPEQYRAVTAYILKINGYPAGDTPDPGDAAGDRLHQSRSASEGTLIVRSRNALGVQTTHTSSSSAPRRWRSRLTRVARLEAANAANFRSSWSGTEEKAPRSASSDLRFSS